MPEVPQPEPEKLDVSSATPPQDAKVIPLFPDESRQPEIGRPATDPETDRLFDESQRQVESEMRGEEPDPFTGETTVVEEATGES